MPSPLVLIHRPQAANRGNVPHDLVRRIGEQIEGSLTPGTNPFHEMGFRLLRGFRALKIWFTLMEHGTKKLGEVIAQNIAQAAHLVARIEEASDLALVASAPLNIVCFRWVSPDLDDRKLDEINRRLLVAIHESGRAIVSSTRLGAKFCLRASITNHRSRFGDLDFLVATASELRTKIAKEECRHAQSRNQKPLRTTVHAVGC